MEKIVEMISQPFCETCRWWDPSALVSRDADPARAPFLAILNPVEGVLFASRGLAHSKQTVGVSPGLGYVLVCVSVCNFCVSVCNFSRPLIFPP